MDRKTRTISKLDSTGINCSFMGLCTYLAKPDTKTAPLLQQQGPQNPGVVLCVARQLGSLSLTCQAPLQGQMGAEQSDFTSPPDN